MVLMYCRECGKQVSSEAPTCPHCGAPYPTGIREAPGPAPERPRGTACRVCGGFTVRSTGVCKRCERAGPAW